MLLKFNRLKIAFVMALFCGALAAWAEPKVEASLDRDTIGLNETATLTFSFTDSSVGHLSLPNLPGIQVVGGASESHETAIVGTQISSIDKFSYQIKPLKVGVIHIPNLNIDTNGKKLSSNPLTLRVTKGSTLPTNPEDAFVQIIVPQRAVYVGETVPLEVRGYVQAARDAQPPQIANTEGFRLGNMGAPAQPGQISLNGRVYQQVIYHAPMTITKTGPLKIGPATWPVTLLYGGPDFFGQFREARPATLTSDAPVLQALALPGTNVPSGFNGMIGSLSLVSYEASPTNVSVGDPITIKIRIAARGALDMLTIPQDPTAWREFKTYPTTTKIDTDDPLQLRGSKYFEQVVVPQNAGITELPAFELTYFDPEQKAYRVLSHPAIPLTVKPAAATPQPTVFSAQTSPSETPPPAQEIIHIKQELGALTTTNKPLIQRFGFLVLQAVAPLLWLAAIAWRRQKEKLANNPRLRRQREVARTVRNGLKNLSTLAQSNKIEDFYATTFHLLQEQVGERLDLPASAITEADLDKLNLHPETLASVRELFQHCNQFRYAPEHAPQDLDALIPQVQGALGSLQSVKHLSNGLLAVIILAVLFTASSALAQSETFHDANKLYEEGHYPAAIAAYEGVMKTNGVNATLYFNLGNAYFKSGQPGRAILSYKKAEKLSPRDPDIRANLQFARNQIGAGNAVLPGSRWTGWTNHLTLDEWSLMTAGVVALFFLTLAARQFFPKAKKPLAKPALYLGIAGLILMACLSMALSNASTREAVVIVPEAVIRRGPFDESQSVFSARDGMELEVTQSQGDWFQVIDSAKRTGWVRQSEIQTVRQVKPFLTFAP